MMHKAVNIYAGFHADTIFQLIWVYTKNAVDGFYDKRGFCFMRNCQTLPKWPYHTVFPPAANGRSSGSTCSLVSAGVSVWTSS